MQGTVTLPMEKTTSYTEMINQAIGVVYRGVIGRKPSQTLVTRQRVYMKQALKVVTISERSCNMADPALMSSPGSVLFRLFITQS